MASINGPDPLDAVPAAIVSELRRRHAEPQRAYHDWRHIEELLAFFDDVAGELHDPDAVLYAILFHDCVYDPHRGDNEDRSGDLLRDLGGDTLYPGSLETALHLIAATKGHRLPEGLTAAQVHDARHFLDMDLSILGAAPARFEEYERQIRAEYAFVPEDAFRAGRSRILRGFLQREELYFSDWGRSRFGAAAVRNVTRALRALETEAR